MNALSKLLTGAAIGLAVSITSFAAVAETPANMLPTCMVVQSLALFPHMSVAENLAFPLKVRGMAPGDVAAKVADALDMVELEDFGARMSARLSGGQQQRVAVARALGCGPRPERSTHHVGPDRCLQ